MTSKRFVRGLGLACALAGWCACSGDDQRADEPLDTNVNTTGGAANGSAVGAPAAGSGAVANTGQNPALGPLGEADASAEDGASNGSTDAEAPTGPSFPSVSDFAARGPFDTLNEASDADCTVFRPMTLGDGGLRHPILLWGNGTVASPTLYAGVLDHWASHGFIVAAANTSSAGSGEPMIACLDWVIAQDALAGSAYAAHVDAAHVGTSGHSQGGGGAIMAGRDARIGATAPLEPYTQGLGHVAASQSQQHGPMLLLSGGADTIAPSDGNQRPVFEAVNVPTFWGTLAGADHVTSATGDITGFRGPATAWFRLHLMGDESARPLFYGATCTLCSDAMWDVQRKDIQ